MTRMMMSIVPSVMALSPNAARRVDPRAADGSKAYSGAGVVGGTVIPGWCVSTRPGISRFSGAQLRTIVRLYEPPRNDEPSTGSPGRYQTRNDDDGHDFAFSRRDPPEVCQKS